MEHVCHPPIGDMQRAHTSPHPSCPHTNAQTASRAFTTRPLSPPGPSALRAVASVTARPLLVQNLSLTPTHRLPLCSLQREIGGRMHWLGVGSGCSQGEGASQERRDWPADKAWDVRSHRQAEGRGGAIPGTDWWLWRWRAEPGWPPLDCRGPALCQFLHEDAAPNPGWRDTGARPGSAAG